MQKLARRYLQAFGPASVADLSQFAKVARVTARHALQAQADTLELLEGPDGTELFDVPGAPRPAEDTPAYRQLIIQSNGDVLPTLLVDGYVAGVWRPVEAGIEATAFHPLPDDAWGGLADEARAMVAFLADREPMVYRRYARWWTRLPTAEVRVLPG